MKLIYIVFGICMFLVIFVPKLSLTEGAEGDVSDEDEEDDKSDDNKKPKFSTPKCPADNYLCLFFQSPDDIKSKLIPSEARKDGVATDIAKYDGKWSVEIPLTVGLEGDYGLVLKSKARHNAVSTKLQRVFSMTSPTDQFVVQYEVKFQNGMECGGAYIKLISDSPELNLREFNDKTPYTIMFGPDKCGQDVKLHFILRHRNPVNGVIEEKHSKKPKGDIESFFSDKKSHLYTLVLNSDNTFEIYVDRSLISSGNLLDDLEPSINPPREIDDPSDKKPDNWDDREKIADPKASKPEDWDETQPEFIPDPEGKKPEGWLDNEPLTIPDPKATKPKDWDEDMDGSWEAPQIDNPMCKSAPGCGTWKPAQIKNPKYKGKWSPPMIDNKDYQGIWKPRRIPNPNFFEDKEPWKITPIAAVGLELWSMTDAIVFDNFLIVSKKKDADDFAETTFVLKQKAEKLSDPSAQSVVDAVREATKEKPWIWAIVLLVVVLPLVLIIVYCCFRKSDSTSQQPRRQDVAQHKKTDNDTPTNKASLEEEGEQEEEEEEEDDDVVPDDSERKHEDGGVGDGPRKRTVRKD